MPDAPHSAAPSFRLIAGRLLAAVGGSYALIYALVSVITAGGYRLGMHYDDAWLLAAMLAFPVLLGAVLWAFSCRSLRRVVVVFVGGAAILTLLTWLLVRSAPVASP